MTDTEEITEYVATRYRCTWCKKSWGSRTLVEKHQPRCWYRPTNAGCKTCKHFIPHETFYSRDEPSSPEHCDLGISLDSPHGLRNILGEIQTEPKINCPSWQGEQ